jgi:heme A synthase
LQNVCTFQLQVGLGTQSTDSLSLLRLEIMGANRHPTTTVRILVMIIMIEVLIKVAVGGMVRGAAEVGAADVAEREGKKRKHQSRMRYHEVLKRQNRLWCTSLHLIRPLQVLSAEMSMLRPP